MNITDLNAAWLADQKKTIAKEIRELAGIFVEYTLIADDKDKYLIRLELSYANYSVDVFDPETYETIEKVEQWCINSTLDHYLILNRTDVTSKVNELLNKIKEMKKLVQKYMQLNKQS